MKFNELLESIENSLEEINLEKINLEESNLPSTEEDFKSYLYLLIEQTLKNWKRNFNTLGVSKSDSNILITITDKTPEIKAKIHVDVIDLSIDVIVDCKPFASRDSKEVDTFFEKYQNINKVVSMVYGIVENVTRIKKSIK